MAELPIIDTPRFSQHLRDKAVRLDSHEVLITNFDGSRESQDFTVPANCGGFGRIHHFRRDQGKDWPLNPLPIDPALKALSLPPADSLRVQVFQNAVCSWRCWYCFVDFDLLSANRLHSEFKTAEDLLDLYLAEPDRPFVVDLSGGQPDLVPEWGLWFLNALKARGIGKNVYLWTDDNLSNDYLWRFLKPAEIRVLAETSNYGRVGCFKGFDQTSFSFNSKADPSLFAQQFSLMRRLVNEGFDVFGYATFTSPDDTQLENRVRIFVDRLQEEIHPLFPLRLVPLRVTVYTPTRHRLDPQRERSLAIQMDVVALWERELRSRYSPERLSLAITEHKVSDR